MSETDPAALVAKEAAPRIKPSNYPEPFASRMAGRIKQPLGDLFGLTQFGVNRTKLPPGTVSALFHAHSLQDEFVFILEGTPHLVTENGETALSPGMCAGFKAGGSAHYLINRSNSDVVFIEIGNRIEGDEVQYPEDDLMAVMGDDGKWKFTRKDGTDY